MKYVNFSSLWLAGIGGAASLLVFQHSSFQQWYFTVNVLCLVNFP